MANVLIEEQTMKDIGNAIRLKSGTEKKLKPYEMPKAIGDIPSADIIDATYANSISFYGVNTFPKGYKNGTLHIKLPNAQKSLYNFFSLVKQKIITELILDSNAKITDMAAFAVNSGSLKTLTLNFDTKNVSNWRDWLSMDGSSGSNRIETITNPIDLTSGKWNNSSFCYGQSALKNIRFVPNTICFNFYLPQTSVLTDESVQSIIDGLADLTGQTAQAIYLHSSVVKRLTNEQLTQISNKNWSLG